jgi:hypothetical protein
MQTFTDNRISSNSAWNGWFDSDGILWQMETQEIQKLLTETRQ